MKKLITTIAFIALSTVSAKAIDMEMFSITGGIAANQSVFGATAKQDDYNAAGTTIETTDKEHGAFTESFGSQFVELGIGRWVSLGFEHVPDSISTPQNVNSGGNDLAGTGTGDTATVSVDFNDMNTTYVKLNTPMGIYFKYGTVSTDLDIKETQLSGNTYKNTSVDGTSMGAGYQKTFGERGFGFRIEGNYVELDNVTVNNGVTKTGGTAANHGFAEVKAKNLEGLTGKVALTYTFGRSGNSF